MIADTVADIQIIIIISEFRIASGAAYADFLSAAVGTKIDSTFDVMLYIAVPQFTQNFPIDYPPFSYLGRAPRFSRSIPYGF
jgi:hypothetical protein